jgi:hypothetical protein
LLVCYRAVLRARMRLRLLHSRLLSQPIVLQHFLLLATHFKVCGYLWVCYCHFGYVIREELVGLGILRCKHWLANIAEVVLEAFELLYIYVFGKMVYLRLCPWLLLG